MRATIDFIDMNIYRTVQTKGLNFFEIKSKGNGLIFFWFSFNQNTVHQVNFIRLTDLHVDGDDKKHTCVTNS